MAKVAISKKLTAKPKIKQPRLSRSAVKTIDDKYYGSEPIDISVRGFTNALNWYNYMFDQDGVRDWIFEYMKRNEYARSDIAAVKRIPKYRVAKTDCVIARIIMNGNTLSEEVMGRFKVNINAYISAGQLIKEEVVATAAVEKTQPTIQERTKLKIQQLLSECEDATDSDAALNIYEWLKGKEASVQAATAIRDHYAAWLPDFEEDEFDTRIMKKKRAERKKYWESFIADCDRYCGNKKATKVRKPREKKAKSAVDLVSKIKYQKEFPSLKIMSVNPAEMIGASQVWTYNTKYRKLTRYDASGPRGIQVKGASLIGYDVEKSQTKSVRKPEVTIQQLLGAGKVALRSIMAELKTNETQPNGRINMDTVILRVIK